MKQSKFNVVIPLEDGNNLIFNTFSDSRVIISKEAEEVLHQCHQNKKRQHKEIEMLSQLNDLGIVIDDKMDEDKELEYWFQKLKFDSTAINATVLTTLSCNMDCSYCFEKGIEADSFMTQAKSEQVCSWLIRKMKAINTKEITITFFGGEPLLNQKAVKYMSKTLHEAAQKERVLFKVKIITNGLLLSEELVDYLKPYGLDWVKVTLDGDESTHNMMRLRKNGSGSYKKIISNLLTIKDKVNIAIGGNYNDSTKKSIPLMLDDLRAAGFNGEIKEMAFKPIMAFPDHEQVSSYLHEACTFSDTNVDDIFWLVEETEKRGFKPFKKIALGPCEAIREHTYTFDPTGNIYKCAALAGREEFAVGHIEREINTTKNVEFMTADVWRKCKECKFVPLCNGGCRVSAILKTNNLDGIACEKKYFEKVSKKLILSELN